MIFVTIFFVLWTIRILANILSYVQLWYVKEYRLDRMLIHLKTNQGKRLFILPFRRPPITIKTVLLFCSSVGSLFVLYIILPFSLFSKFFLIDLSSFFIIGVYVFFLRIPTFLYHFWQIQKARKKLRDHSHMNVIGITGSYGKTSTKEFLATLLSQKYVTLKTEKSKNSPIGIAEVVLSQLQDNHSAFVVEMGAYKPREIAEMCALVQPEIGIITAINPQHQDLFGSIEATVTAKYELVSGLSGKKILIVNADNSYTYDMGQRAIADGCAVYYYSVIRDDVSWFATDCIQNENMVSFQIHFGKNSKNISVSLLGVYQISNILAACAVAEVLGLTFDEITKGIGKIQPLEKTMIRVKTIIDAECIDDTFNNNPDAALASLSYLQTRSGKKVFVFQPMIELGKYAKESHVRVGKMAGIVCDEILLTNENYYDDFISGVKKGKSSVPVTLASGKKAALYIQSKVGKGDTVLFKGKESARVLAELQRETL